MTANTAARRTPADAYSLHALNVAALAELIADKVLDDTDPETVTWGDVTRIATIESRLTEIAALLTPSRES